MEQQHGIMFSQSSDSSKARTSPCSSSVRSAQSALVSPHTVPVRGSKAKPTSYIMLSLLWLGTLLVEASALSGTWCTNEPHNQENTMVAMDEHHTVLALMYQGELQQARFSIDNTTLGPDWGLLALTLECSSASVSLFQANEHLSYTLSPNTLCVDLRFVGLRCLPACPDFSTDSYLCSGSTSLSTGMLAFVSTCVCSAYVLTCFSFGVFAGQLIGFHCGLCDHQEVLLQPIGGVCCSSDVY